ncbi:hypothetical protein Mesau_05755 [Mesorhizobium australicum WSM2073]|uniref:Uncharacterized protein n=3 Tax=Mesorhizobium TaxID=68287 RepID=L0KVM7_MESAW|nr:hypothetical protein Mesci_5703 [Mesorhizobium ciceri biovar biserrulae WSM1271]AEH90657.1 Fe-S type hydro-lyase tartrate/fumarate alpha region [Mesorhizobium opportunistum WSM2075]AGB48029.1 hypothetical protein Mesau_05755 [Mesorhizobium australicum WSM2073]
MRRCALNRSRSEMLARISQSVADALRVHLELHPPDCIRYLSQAYAREQSQAAKNAIGQILLNSRSGTSKFANSPHPSSARASVPPASGNLSSSFLPAFKISRSSIPRSGSTLRPSSRPRPDPWDRIRRRHVSSSRASARSLLRGSEQRLLDQVRQAFGELADAILEACGTGLAKLEPEIAQDPPDVVLDGSRLVLQQLACRQQCPTFWLVSLASSHASGGTG